MIPRFLVVSGLPASGKTTLARQLGAALELAVLDKDDFLEHLFAESHRIAPDERRALSRRADDEFIRASMLSSGAVLVSFWRRPELSETSGTPTEWLASLPGVVEVYCACSPEVAARRFAARTRHPAHGDSAVDEEQRLSTFRRLGSFGPLGLATVVTVNTEAEVDVGSVLAELATRP